MLNAVLPVLGTDRLNFQPFEIGLLFSVINAIGIGAVLLGGTFGDRFGRYRMLVPALGVLALALALLFTIQNQVTYVLLGCFKAPRASSIHCRPSSMGDALTPRPRSRGIAVYRAVCDLA